MLRKKKSYGASQTLTGTQRFYLSIYTMRKVSKYGGFTQ